MGGIRDLKAYPHPLNQKHKDYVQHFEVGIDIHYTALREERLLAGNALNGSPDEDPSQTI